MNTTTYKVSCCKVILDEKGQEVSRNRNAEIVVALEWPEDAEPTGLWVRDYLTNNLVVRGDGTITAIYHIEEAFIDTLPDYSIDELGNVMSA